MTGRKLGDIDLHDYLAIVRKRRPGHWTRRVGTAAALILAFTAGRFAPWSGKGSDKLTMAEAMKLLDTRAEEGWEHELAVGAVFRHAYFGIEAIARVAEQTDQAGTDASVYLGTIALTASKEFMKQAVSPDRKKLLSSTLTRLRDTVKE
jgi:hypothetical protein